MPEIEFLIDTATGEFHTHVQGVAGPACDDIARLVKELAGEPGTEHATAEYFLRSVGRARAERRIQPKRGEPGG